MASSTQNDEADKEKLKRFLSSFTTVDDNGRNKFPYADQLTRIAHRKQV